MAYRNKDQIEWYLFGEVALGTQVPTQPQGSANRPLGQLFDNIDYLKNAVDSTNAITPADLTTYLNDYYNRTEVDALLAGIGGGITDHNALNNIQGGNTTERYHLSLNSYNDLTNTTQSIQNSQISSIQSQITTTASTANSNSSRISTLESTFDFINNPIGLSHIKTYTLTDTLSLSTSNTLVATASVSLTDYTCAVFIRHILYIPSTGFKHHTDWLPANEWSNVQGYTYTLSGTSIYLSSTNTYDHTIQIQFCAGKANISGAPPVFYGIDNIVITTV